MASGRGSAAIGLVAVALSATLAVSDLSLAWPRRPARPSAPVASARERQPSPAPRSRAAIPGDERVLVPATRAVTVSRFRSELATASDANWSLLEVNEVSRSVDVSIEVAAFTHSSRDEACVAAVELTRGRLSVQYVYITFHYPWFRGNSAYEYPTG